MNNFFTLPPISNDVVIGLLKKTEGLAAGWCVWRLQENNVDITDSGEMKLGVNVDTPGRITSTIVRGDIKLLVEEFDNYDVLDYFDQLIEHYKFEKETA